MKTSIILILLLSISIAHQAQPSNFLRVFDPSGKKIAKGQLSGTTEQSLMIKKDSKIVEIPFERIGHIITKRSFGNNVLVSSLVFGGLTAFIGEATKSKSSNSSLGSGSSNYINVDLSFGDYNAALGLVAGVVVGSTVGAIIGGTKKTEHFNVNGNKEEWKKVKAILNMKILNASTKNKKI